MDANYVTNASRQNYAHAPPRDEAYRWHISQSGFAPTPLVELEQLAARLGFDRIWAKDERGRWGTTSFKILGASWALNNALAQNRAAGRDPVDTLFAASDGNHGAAVARLASLHGLSSEIFVPEELEPERITAIEREGGAVRVVDGTYDEAVRMAAVAAAKSGLLVSDTALRKDDPTPEWTIEGNGTIFRETEEELMRRGMTLPDLILVQMGVGGLAAAAIRHFRSASGSDARHIIGVEPVSAACVTTSIASGRISTIESRFASTMAGLNAQTPSLTAWDDLLYGLDGSLTISDRWCAPAAKELAAAGLPPGPTGLAGLAGLLALHDLRSREPSLNWLHEVRTVMIVVTEGQ